MSPLHQPAALAAAANVHPETGDHRLDWRQFLLVLLSDALFLDGSATLRATGWQKRLNRAIDCPRYRPVGFGSVRFPSSAPNAPARGRPVSL